MKHLFENGRGRDVLRSSQADRGAWSPLRGTQLFAGWQGELAVLWFNTGLGQAGRQPACACESVDLVQDTQYSG